VFIAPLERAAEVRDVVEQLKRDKRDLATMPSRVERPWGSYETKDRGQRFQIKHIMVAPGETLSLQMHYHRSEHWVVVSGSAEVTVGDKVQLLQENQSTYIPAGTTHRLANPGKVPLELVEVQCGPYLGEDDIVRFDDQYGRA
jgi:mannose-1-phosphate guanylyltransferase/mannose-6-phosphate isomerase